MIETPSTLDCLTLSPYGARLALHDSRELARARESSRELALQINGFLGRPSGQRRISGLSQSKSIRGSLLLQWQQSLWAPLCASPGADVGVVLHTGSISVRRPSSPASPVRSDRPTVPRYATNDL